MTVVVSRRELGVCRHEFDIEVPAAEVDSEYLRVARNYRRRARLDGFRKGKAPLELVRQRFAEEIGDDVVDRLAPKYWVLARKEEDVHAMLPPTIGSVKAVPGRPLRFTITVDVEPEVDLGDDRRFDLPEPETEPTEAEIDELLEQLRVDHSTWAPVDRPAMRGDRVRGTLRFLGKEKHGARSAGEEHDRGRDPDSRCSATDDIDVELGGEKTWDELTDNLTGISAGQTAAFEYIGQEDDVETRERYEVDLHEVLERKLPEVDDDWTNSLDAGSVDDLRQVIRGHLRDRNVEIADREREDALIAQLCERYPVDLPEAVVDREVTRIAESYAHELARRGVNPDMREVHWEQILEAVRPQAARRAQAGFLLDRIAREEKIEATREDVERTLEIMARKRDTSRGKLRRELARDGVLEALARRIRRTRTVEALLAASAKVDRSGGTGGEPLAEGDD